MTKPIILYARLSSQNKQNNSVSIESQMFVAKQHISMFMQNANVIGEYSEVCSARNMNKLQVLNKIIKNNKDCILMVHNISRFSRNLQQATNLLTTMKTKNIDLISVSEACDTSTINGIHQINTLISQAELESNMTSLRIIRSINFRKQLGHHIGNAKFGYKIERVNGIRKLCANDDEQCVLNFIIACRTPKTSSKFLNILLNRISVHKEPLELDDCDYIVNVLAFENIADILNEYEVPYKNGKQWTSNNVGYVYKQNMNKHNIVDKMARLTIE